MARPETWRKLRYFKPDSTVDSWGDPDEINDNLLLRLDDFRHWLGVPVVVTSGVRNSANKGSFHRPENGACAVDVVIPSYMETPFDLIMDALRFGFTGLGYYPHWHYKGKAVGGLHLDMRPLKWDSDDTLNYSHSRWMGVLGSDGKQHYIELDFENLLDYCGQDLSLNKLH